MELEWVLDEGGVVIKDGLPPLTNTPIAVVGTAEKVLQRVGPAHGCGGLKSTSLVICEIFVTWCARPQDYSVVEVEVKGAGGHAMMPPVDGSSVRVLVLPDLAGLFLHFPPEQLACLLVSEHCSCTPRTGRSRNGPHPHCCR